MNVLAPGVVMTQLIEHDMQDPRKAAGIKSLPMPLGRFARPENNLAFAAAAEAFLAATLRQVLSGK